MEKAKKIDLSIPPELQDRLSEAGNLMDAMLITDEFLNENPENLGALRTVLGILIAEECQVQADAVYGRLIDAFRAQQGDSMRIPREIQRLEKKIKALSRQTLKIPQYGGRENRKNPDDTAHWTQALDL